MKSLITGATGLVGSELVGALPSAVALSRDPIHASAKLGVPAHFWRPQNGPPTVESLTGVDVVFHLAGEPVAGRWSTKKKRRIRDSRVLGTRNLVTGLAGLERKPKVLVCASAVGIYGDRGDDLLSESAEPGDGFLADVCREWEREALKAALFGVRVVCLRIGIVLAQGGGALAKMMTPFKMGVGGRLGSGRQWMPWIHLDDVVGLLLHAADTESVSGPMNAVAPHPVTNAEFTRALGKALGRPTLLPMPKAALRVAFGEMSEIMLASQRVVPTLALESGYSFQYPELAAALNEAKSDKIAA